MSPQTQTTNFKIVIIPLGGIGSRFKNQGYKEPKALVPVQDKPIIFWLIDNLSIVGDDSTDILFIPYNSEYRDGGWDFEAKVKERYPSLVEEKRLKFLCLEEQTRGAAETLLIALEHLVKDPLLSKELSNPEVHVPVCSIDSDSFYVLERYDVLKAWGGVRTVSLPFWISGRNLFSPTSP